MGNYGQPGHYEQPANGTGSSAKDHVVRKWDRRNIQNCYSRDGREAKMRANALARVSTRTEAPCDQRAPCVRKESKENE